jgi:3-oxoacyl-[acyl-carrier protein] reductase
VVNYVRDEKAANQVIAEAEAQGVGALAVQADVSLKGDAQRLIDATARRFDRVDFLVCNAGIWEGSPIDQMTEEVWNRTMDLNLKGTWSACRSAVPREAPGLRPNRNSSSTAGQRGEANVSNYAASKAARFRPNLWQRNLGRSASM